jgi:hypothetical protein
LSRIYGPGDGLLAICEQSQQLLGNDKQLGALAELTAIAAAARRELTGG